VSALATDRLTKDYALGFWRNGHRALDRLTLEVSAGEVLASRPERAGTTTPLLMLVFRPWLRGDVAALSAILREASHRLPS
jgi:hypothetical protein